MKNLLVILIAVMIITGFCSFVSEAGSGAGITGSPHDFSSEAWNASGEICRVCHVPHDGGRASTISGLMWNHNLSTATYTMYNSATSSSLQGAVSNQPDGISKLCLACHDGIVAVDAFDGQMGGAYYIPASAKVPNVMDGSNLDLRGTHPISIVYDTTADNKLKDSNTTQIGNSGMIKDVLDHGKVQCSSCHDVHDQVSVAGTKLLRVNKSGSQLCLTCHIK